jgi:predicted nucleic acid-binding protein
MAFVVDASSLVAAYFPDEADMAVLFKLADETAAAPWILPLEVANAFAVGVRRKRLTETKAEEALESVEALPITLHETPFEVVSGELFPLAMRHGLTLYDASYLRLAVTLRMQLATRDERLRRAAAEQGVSTL